MKSLPSKALLPLAFTTRRATGWPWLLSANVLGLTVVTSTPNAVRFAGTIRYKLSAVTPILSRIGTTAWACAGREANNGANTAMINKLRKIDERRIRIHLIRNDSHR